MIKNIPHFKDYFISDSGVVYSTAKRANTKKSEIKRVLSTFISNTYKRVQLQRNGKSYKRYVHRLVLEAFVGECPEGYQCRHLDSNPLNNNIKNLKWGTRKENQRDRISVGRDNKGERHGRSKLTKEKVIAIKMLREKGCEYKYIALKFKVCPSTIGHIIRGNTWND